LPERSAIATWFDDELTDTATAVLTAIDTVVVFAIFLVQVIHVFEVRALVLTIRARLLSKVAGVAAAFAPRLVDAAVAAAVVLTVPILFVL
jgi:hypothetical protein